MGRANLQRPVAQSIYSRRRSTDRRVPNRSGGHHAGARRPWVRTPKASRVVAVTAAALAEAASTAVAFMEASLAVGSTVEDFTEDVTADFTDARLQGTPPASH